MELQQVNEIVVAQNGQDFLRDQDLMRTAVERIDTLAKEVDRLNTQLLKASIQKENQQTILLTHLSNLLSEREEEFNRTGQFESYEFACNYVEAAKAAKELGRKVDIVADVEKWMNSKYALNF